jgi:hypothetical protein
MEKTFCLQTAYVSFEGLAFSRSSLGNSSLKISNGESEKLKKLEKSL